MRCRARWISRAERSFIHDDYGYIDSALTWWDFIEPSFSGNGAFLYEDENPREIYFCLAALREKLKA